jgi:pyrophosphatase PpaX
MDSLLESKAVLFDLDGTLLDTFEFIFGAFEYSLSRHGLTPPTRPVLASRMGGPLEECYQVLAPDSDYLSLTACHRDFQAENLHLVRLFPGAKDVLKYLKLKHKSIAAITTRSIRTSIKSIQLTGISDYFDLVISVEDVEKPKPDPEPILKASNLLRLEPCECVMVGDTFADIECGKNAGALTIAALYGFGGEPLLALQPTTSIRDIIELIDLL